MRTYEELLAAQTELAHFNKYHDPKTGQFASKNGGSTHHPLKDKPGTLDEAREKGLIGQNKPITVRETTVKTRPAEPGTSQKDIRKFNEKAMKLADKISERAAKANGLYSAAMSMAIRGTQGDIASKKAAGLVYEAAMKNRKLMNKYVDKLQNMGVKFRSDDVDNVNSKHLAAGEGFIKRTLTSRIADYIVPFWGYANPSDHKINEEFVKQFT